MQAVAGARQIMLANDAPHRAQGSGLEGVVVSRGSARLPDGAYGAGRRPHTTWKTPEGRRLSLARNARSPFGVTASLLRWRLPWGARYGESVYIRRLPWFVARENQCQRLVSAEVGGRGDTERRLAAPSLHV